jgi:hypothetical protein
MVIINTLPTTILNGQIEDATVVMSLFNWIVAQTNGNACPATTGSSVLKGDGSGGTATASPGVDYVAPSGAIGTLNWAGTSTGSANAQLLAPASAITSYAAGESFDFLAGFTNTGALQVNVSSVGLVNVLKKASGGLTALVAADVVAGNAYRITYDGTQFELINIRAYSQGAAIASAATINLDTATGDYVHVTGAVTITAITLAQGEERTVVFDSTPILTAGASLILPGVVSRTAAAGDCAKFRGEASGVVRCVQYTPASGQPVTSSSPNNYITSLIMSTAGASATMSISAGQASNSANAVLMTLGSAISKTTSAWAVGTGNGGLDTGAVANSTWYHFYLIRRPDTGVVDVVFSLSASAPTLPTNYTQYRRIGSGKTNASAQWTKFVQTGNTFLWDAYVIDVNANNPGAVAVSRTLTVPSGVIVDALLISHGTNGSNANGVWILSSPLSVSDQAPAQGLSDFGYILNVAGYTNIAASKVTVTTNTSAQIRTRASFSDGNLTQVVSTIGWIDSRGANP